MTSRLPLLVVNLRFSTNRGDHLVALHNYEEKRKLCSRVLCSGYTTSVLYAQVQCIHNETDSHKGATQALFPPFDVATYLSERTRGLPIGLTMIKEAHKCAIV